MLNRYTAFEGELSWYAFWFTRELVLIYPVYAIMMGDLGIGPAELAALMVIWSASAIAFEVPTGALGDRFSRKTVLVASGLIKSTAFVVWLAEPHFWGFAFGFLVWSFASTLSSGTEEAYLHEHLAAAGVPEEFARVYGWAHVASSSGIVLALLLGGRLAESGYTLPLALSVLAPLAAATVAAIGFRDPPRVRDDGEAGYFAILRAGVVEAFGNRALLLLVMLFALVFSGYQTVDEYLGPFFDELGFSLTEVGLLSASLYAARTLAVGFAHRLSGLSMAHLTLGFAIGTGALVISPLPAGYWPALALAAYFAISTVGEIVLMGRLQRDMKGEARATTTSVASMAADLFAIAAFTALGALAQWWSWGISFMVFGAVSIVLAAMIGFALRALRAGEASV